MAESIVSVDTVSIVGGPSTVKVDVDLGATGQRGSLILYGLGKPTDPSVTFRPKPQLLDWYINLDVNDSEYQYIYQYIIKDGIYVWNRIFKIVPNVFNENKTITFVNGVAMENDMPFITIAVDNTTLPLLGAGGLSIDNANVHISIEKPGVVDLNNAATWPLPVASSFKLLAPTTSTVDGVTTLVLPIAITAAQFMPNPTADVTVQSLSQMLALTPTAGGDDLMYTVYVIDNNTFYIFNGTGLPIAITSWTPFSNVQNYNGEAKAHISINVI